MAENLTEFFETFVSSKSLFKNKMVLQSDYSPDSLQHRDEQIQKIASIVAPALRLEKPSNLFLYGKTGTGKTVTVKYTLNELLKVTRSKNLAVSDVYINCKLKRVADTEYRLISNLINELGSDVPATGLPTDEVYKIFYNLLESKKTLLIIVLDEVDQLVKKAGDDILYNLTRINSELKNSVVCVIGISNDLLFVDSIDPRVKSSLGEEELVFPPYDAKQLYDILHERSKIAFEDGVVSAGMIEKCAAIAAKEHGDARRAIDLLRVAGEIAERQFSKTIDIKHLDLAQSTLERDRILDIVKTQPIQFHATLYSIFTALKSKKSMDASIFTGSVYSIYQDVCTKSGLRALTLRRVSDIISELNTLGIINATVISKGRGGRTREIQLGIPFYLYDKVLAILKSNLHLD